MSELDWTIMIVTLVSMVAAIPLGALIVRLLARREERASALIKLVNRSSHEGNKPRLDFLNDLVNISSSKRDAPLMRSYKKFIYDHGSTEINAVHRALLEAGVRDPSKNMTDAQITTADRIIKKLIDQGTPAAEWEYHPLTSHAVVHGEDADLLHSIIGRGVTDHEQALQLLSVMKASPSAALLDGVI